VRLCIQTSSKSSNSPVLLLELGVPTKTLAREMRGGILRIALECEHTADASNWSLLSVLVWTMYCKLWEESFFFFFNMSTHQKIRNNGGRRKLRIHLRSNERKIENAFKYQPSKAHMDAIRLMSAVVIGVGMISKKDQLNSDNVPCGSPDSKSFHLIDSHGIPIG
jgi:hypothetical protein